MSNDENVAVAAPEPVARPGARPAYEVALDISDAISVTEWNRNHAMMRLNAMKNELVAIQSAAQAKNSLDGIAEAMQTEEYQTIDKGQYEVQQKMLDAERVLAHLGRDHALMLALVQSNQAEAMIDMPDIPVRRSLR